MWIERIWLRTVFSNTAISFAYCQFGFARVSNEERVTFWARGSLYNGFTGTNPADVSFERWDRPQSIYYPLYDYICKMWLDKNARPGMDASDLDALVADLLERVLYDVPEEYCIDTDEFTRYAQGYYAERFDAIDKQSMPGDGSDVWLDVRTVQLHLQISLTSIYKLIHQGEIPIMASYLAFAISQNLGDNA